MVLTLLRWSALQLKPKSSDGLSIMIRRRAALIRSPFKHEVQEIGVVRHRIEVVGMRPIGAPQQAFGRPLDESVHERKHVIERDCRLRRAARRQLDPATPRIDAFEGEPEARIVKAPLDLRIAHVLDHEAPLASRGSAPATRQFPARHGRDSAAAGQSCCSGRACGDRSISQT